MDTTSHEDTPLQETISAEPNEGQASKSAPIQSVPNEILGKIFEYYIEMDQSPWNLTFVSRSWRIVAVEDPNLWTYIYIIGGMRPSALRSFTKWTISGQPHPIYTLGNSQVCTTEDDLLLSVGRAGSGSLNVKIYFNLQEATSSRLLQCIFGHPLSSRIRRLDLYIKGYSRSTFTDIQLGPFTSLEHLIVNTGTTEELAIKIAELVQETSLTLKELYIGSRLLKDQERPNSMWTLESMELLLGRLRYLTMEQSGSVDAILPKCRRLIGFRCYSSKWPDIWRTKDGVLANIQALDLRCSPSSLPHHGLISLRELILINSVPHTSSSPFQDSSSGIPKLSLPKLTYLHVRGHTLSWLCHLEAPALREVELLTSQDKCDCFSTKRGLDFQHLTCIVQVLSWSGLSNLSKLVLEAGCKEEFFASILAVTCDLRSLNIVKKTNRSELVSGSHILDQLVAISAAGSLRQLEMFTLGSEEWPVRISNDTLGHQAKLILKLRATKGKPMLRFDVHSRFGKEVRSKSRHFVK